MEKRQSLQQMVLGKLDSDMQKNETGPLSYTIHKKLNSKRMKELSVRQETIKILEEGTGSNLFDLGHSNVLLVLSSEPRETKANMNYWDFKIKSFCTAKETINKTKRHPTEWEKIFADDVFDKRQYQTLEMLVSKIYKELISTLKKTVQ